MCSVYTEGYFGVAPIELGEVFADRSLAFVIRPLFPVLSPLVCSFSSPSYPIRSGSPIQLSMPEKVSLHRLIDATKGYEFDET